MKRRMPLFLALMLGAAGLCRAAAITYYVNLTVGVGGVTGYIVTDGTIGNNPTIADWNLLLNNGTNTFDLLGPLSGPNSPPDTLGYNGTGLSASATQLLFNFGSAGELFWNHFNSDDLCFGFLDCIQGGNSGNGSSLLVGGDFPMLQLASLSGTQVIGTTSVTLSNFPGGSSSTPVSLCPASFLTLVGYCEPVGVVTGTIGGLGSQDYYSFLWGGGAFSATTSITGAQSGASYLFSEGGAGSCNLLAAATLNSSDTFTSTISMPSLAPGLYCIGIDATSPNDPPFSLTFNTPVVGAQTPEPSVLVLLSIGFGMIGAWRAVVWCSRTGLFSSSPFRGLGSDPY